MGRRNRLIDAGRLRVRVDRTFSLTQAADVVARRTVTTSLLSQRGAADRR
jgi:hypothetical protein